MNGHDDEAWLGPRLPLPPPAGLSDEDFQRGVLERLPPPERPVRRALLLLLTGVVSFGALLLTTGGGVGALGSLEAGNLVVPSSLLLALGWYWLDARA